MSRRPVAEILQEMSPVWMALDGVVLTYEGALGDGSPCIRIGVVELTPELRAAIPDSAGGYPVIVDETGPLAPR